MNQSLQTTTTMPLHTMIYFEPITADAVIPTRGSDDAAGFDLYATDWTTIEPGEREVVTTGIRVAIPPGFAGFIWPRSGLAVRDGIDVMAGLIDSDYRGEIKVVLVNHGDWTAVIEKHDRVAQLVVSPIVADASAVESIEGGTNRGSGGFGSTGD